MICLLRGKSYQILLSISNNSINYMQLICSQLNDQTVLFVTIKFNINQVLVNSLHVKDFYLIHRLNPFRFYYFDSERTWEERQWGVTPHSPKLQECRLIITLFSVKTRTLVGGCLTTLQRYSRCILQPKLTGPSAVGNVVWYEVNIMLDWNYCFLRSYQSLF